MIKIPTETTDAVEISEGERRDIITMLPPYVQRAIAEIPESLRLMDEKELRKHVLPNASVQALRNSFWVEYTRCMDKDLKWMRIASVISGICTIEYWAQRVMKSPGLVEWILRPPLSYNKAMEEVLNFGTERLREIMSLPITRTIVDKNGFERVVVEADVANLVLKAFVIADNRLRGSVVQRHELKTLQVSASMKDVRNVMESQSMEDITKKLRDLKKKDALLDQGVVEAEVVEASGEETPN